MLLSIFGSSCGFGPWRLWLSSPGRGATPAQLFTELAKNFKLHDAVRDALINSQIENLEEFRFLFDQETESRFVDSETLLR